MYVTYSNFSCKINQILLVVVVLWLLSYIIYLHCIINCAHPYILYQYMVFLFHYFSIMGLLVYTPFLSLQALSRPCIITVLHLFMTTTGLFSSIYYNCFTHIHYHYRLFLFHVLSLFYTSLWPLLAFSLPFIITVLHRLFTHVFVLLPHNINGFNYSLN